MPVYAPKLSRISDPPCSTPIPYGVFPNDESFVPARRIVLESIWQQERQSAVKSGRISKTLIDIDKGELLETQTRSMSKSQLSLFSHTIGPASRSTKVS